MAVSSQVVSIGQVVQVPVTIASSGTTSAAITTNGLSLVGVHLPATMTSTAITFTASPDGVAAYQPIYNGSGHVSYSIAGGEYIAIDPKDFAGVQFLKLVCGTSEASSRALTCIMKGLS